MSVSESQIRRIKWWSLIRRTSFGLTVLLLVLVVAPALLQLGGLQVVAVNGHSMGQAVPDQSIVITRSVNGMSLNTGDLVVFSAGWLGDVAEKTSVVHRLIMTSSTPVGSVGYTSGDANSIADPQPINLRDDVQLVKAVVPFAGIFYGTSSNSIFFGAIGLTLPLLMVSRRFGLTNGASTPAQ